MQLNCRGILEPGEVFWGSCHLETLWSHHQGLFLVMEKHASLDPHHP